MIAALALTACGGSKQNAVSETSTGKAVDGYLSAASVLCAANGNGITDAGETVVTTDALGNFAFLTACTSTLVTSGGNSIDTGLPFKVRLKAPAGSTFITPLTSLMMDSGLSATQIVSMMGLPVGTDVSQTDPMLDLDLKKDSGDSANHSTNHQFNFRRGTKLVTGCTASHV